MSSINDRLHQYKLLVGKNLQIKQKANFHLRFYIAPLTLAYRDIGACARSALDSSNLKPTQDEKSRRERRQSNSHLMIRPIDVTKRRDNDLSMAKHWRHTLAHLVSQYAAILVVEPRLQDARHKAKQSFASKKTLILVLTLIFQNTCLCQQKSCFVWHSCNRRTDQPTNRSEYPLSSGRRRRRAPPSPKM